MEEQSGFNNTLPNRTRDPFRDVPVSNLRSHAITGMIILPVCRFMRCQGYTGSSSYCPIPGIPMALTERVYAHMVGCQCRRRGKGLNEATVAFGGFDN